MIREVDLMIVAPVKTRPRAIAIVANCPRDLIVAPFILAPAATAELKLPAIIGDHTVRAQHGRALSVIYTLGDLGSALGPPIALALIGVIEIGTLYRLCAGLLLAVVLFALWQAARE